MDKSIYSRSNISTTFCLSKDLKIPFKFKILSLELSNLQSDSTFISIQLISSNKPLTIPIISLINNSKQYDRSSLSTGGSSSSSSPNSINNKWLTLPISYNQLPLNSKIFIVLFNYNKFDKREIMGSCAFNIFNVGETNDEESNFTLKRGYQKLIIYTPADAEMNDSDVSKDINNGKEENLSVMDKLEKKIKLHESGDMIAIDWLDNLTFRKIEQINKKNSISKYTNDNNSGNNSNFLYLEMVQFDIPIVFSDVKYSIINIPNYVDNESNGDLIESTTVLEMSSPLDNYQPIFDPDQYRDYNNDDPIEQKFRKLERIHQSSPLDKDIKPTLKVKEHILNILQKQFFEKLTSQEKNLIWKFRFYLINNFISNKNFGSLQFNNFIINFIKCVNWDDEYEVNEFLNIIKDAHHQFIEELEIVDCLELLSYDYRNPIIRKFAIERLKLARDDELELYLLQLVQALKFENDAFDYDYSTSILDGSNNNKYPSADEDDNEDEMERDIDEELASSSMNSSLNNNSTSEYTFIDSSELNYNANESSSAFFHTANKLITLNSPLANFLIDRAINNPRLISFFYWYVKVEINSERTYKRLNEKLNLDVDGVNQLDSNQATTAEAVTATNLANDQRQYVRDHKIFHKTLNNFIVKLSKTESGKKKLNTLILQVDLLTKIHEISYKIKTIYKKEPTPRKIEILKNLIIETNKHHHHHHHNVKKQVGGRQRHNTESSSSNLDDSNGATNISTSSTVSGAGSISSLSLLKFEPIPLPLDPSYMICGCIPEESSVFKSSLSPLKITFRTTTPGEKYPLMYKIGDDLRQDQFVIQIITLIDKILQNENLDLKLKPYKILALGEAEGLIQFIPNESLSSILGKNQGSILNFLRINNPDNNNELGVKPEIINNYVRSCAGYCVITYLLGVGDRHLDNLLLTKDGYFFHADFGYILGEDPKPFPPLMKLPIQIIEGMGGLTNENYKLFCNYCFIAYLTLRKNSSLILNLFRLMIDSNIPVLKTNNGDELEKIELVLKIKEKFMLELNDEEAILHFQNLIKDSVNAFLPVVIDRLHSLAQYWRA
ncbi:hypothetical protein PACTADRAFT_47778 [Pachysolen tannophilus NRRL Y-2460]|uniref:Phosphatidylinositol 3-kinase VPS34 n=1 Tax=Pachysolen tannophilus NRRL Y-2460 TaxID=669874 RepID=A0A1E4U1T1_PACTA|nr:hypothetical protein PACTADRAFT_47778 [Pachysolen tannophilus NRRL Y-2460]